MPRPESAITRCDPPDGLRAARTGDLAETGTIVTYDARRRVATSQTYRAAAPSAWGTSSYPGGPWTTATPTFQLDLEDVEYTYDVVDNPIQITDWRSASEWPAGAKPVTRTVEYDDLYRVRHVAYAYPSTDDTWTSPFAAENAGNPDTRRAKPSPHVSFSKRVLDQTWAYDWLGNTTSTDDDAHGFYDRSLGAVTNDVYRITGASQAGSLGGSLDAAYDEAGNLTGLRVQRSGTCLPTGATCSQRYAYDWDEIGRLVRARRWDLASPPASDAAPPSSTADVDHGEPRDRARIGELEEDLAELLGDLRYAYDATDDRVLKTAVDASAAEVHIAYVFDSLELRRAPWEDVGGGVYDYRRDAGTEVGYLAAHGVRLARLVYEDSGVPEIVAGGKLHVFLELGDHLGSTSTVLDLATGELVEKGTYQAYGGAESDYRPGRWNEFREDYRFTGKEEDVEVGLTYFGKRFLSAPLARWMGADPLTIQGLAADPNTYAYVHGRPLRKVDPFGLDESDPKLGTQPGVSPAWSDRPLEEPGKGAGGAGKAYATQEEAGFYALREYSPWSGYDALGQIKTSIMQAHERLSGVPQADKEKPGGPIEFAGIIYRFKDGQGQTRYSYTEGVWGGNLSSEPDEALSLVPRGAEAVGSWHTHTPSEFKDNKGNTVLTEPEGFSWDTGAKSVGADREYFLRFTAEQNARRRGAGQEPLKQTVHFVGTPAGRVGRFVVDVVAASDREDERRSKTVARTPSFSGPYPLTIGHEARKWLPAP